MRTKRASYLVVVMLMGMTPARAAEQATGTVIRAIQIAEEGGLTHVTINADGPLPLPLHEPLKDPPRIYFDLAGVNYKISVARSGGVVSRVRVAVHSVTPKVTRIVLDLKQLENYRVDTGELQGGRIRVTIGGAAATALSAPVSTSSPPAPPPPAPPPPAAAMPAPPVPAGNSTPTIVEDSGAAAPTPSRPFARPSPSIAKPSPARTPVMSPEEPRPTPPVRDVEVYRKQVSAPLSRMQALRALVARIDAGENVGSEILASAAEEFTDLRRMLEAVQPSVALNVTHDLLMTSCTFGAMAARLGLDAARDGNPDTRQRAASAAAGSLMLFDRACADLGCSRAPR